ncbi:MAG: hypothetical protein E6575_10315, partial [Bradyrhizobium sp.]|nr:hypothetical protein [Bradyrhizobium sp.]
PRPYTSSKANAVEAAANHANRSVQTVAGSTEEMTNSIGTISRAGGLCSIIVEQHAQKLLTLADRVVILERGTIVHDAPSSALKADPAPLERHLGVASAAAH